MTQETGQQEEKQIEEVTEKIQGMTAEKIAEGDGLQKEVSHTNVHAPESLDEKIDLNAEKKPAQVNFKSSGTIDYEIAYEGENLKINSSNTEEAALIYFFQSLIRLNHSKNTMYSKEHKHQYTSIDRQDINACVRVLNKLVISISQNVYHNMLIQNMTPEEREAMRAAKDKAVKDFDDKVEALNKMQKDLDDKIKAYNLLPAKERNPGESKYLNDQQKSIKAQRKKLFSR